MTLGSSANEHLGELHGFWDPHQSIPRVRISLGKLMSEVFPRLMCQGLKRISVLVFTPCALVLPPKQTSESDFITHRPDFDADSESGIYSMCYHITFSRYSDIQHIQAMWPIAANRPRKVTFLATTE